MASYDGRILANAAQIPLADESVHMCVTSPPYWNLRKYDIPPSIWPAQEVDDPDCPHEWGDWLDESDIREIAKDGTNSRTTTRYYGDPSRKFDGNHQRHRQISECHLCGATLCQLGLEPTIEMYLEHLLTVFDEVHRVLRKDGICFVNLGDSYAQSGGRGFRGLEKHSVRKGRANLAVQVKVNPGRPTDGLKPKDLAGIPWRFALAMQARGWYWRSTIVWEKQNCMPGSQKDRPTSSWEPVFLFAKSAKYFYDYVAIMEPTSGTAHSRGNGTGPKTDNGTRGIERNNPDFSTTVTEVTYSRAKRDVWTIPTEPLTEAHYAAFPQALVEPCILAGTSEHGCCSACGTPHTRIVERQFYGDWHSNQDLKDDGVNRNHVNGDHPFMPPKTIGWRKGCRCPHMACVPAIVFDPFLGSGTVARVAERFNRRWVGLDLGYLELQSRRLSRIEKQLIQV